MAGKDYCAIGKRYAVRVSEGKIPACRWVRLACERQLADLKRKDWQYRFNRKQAARVCQFIENMPHIEGKWKSKNLQLEPWQCFYLTTIFGWMDDEGLRRFRKALIVIPRKNAKTTIAAALGLFLLAADNEPGAQVYSAATTRDQAKLSWGVAAKMVQRTPAIREHYGIEALAHSIAIENVASFYKPLSRDADSLEGLNVHGAIIDELHAHKTRDVFDVIDEATGARRQPLLFVISTEGDASEGVFPEQVDYMERVLAGEHEDESYFGIKYTIDPADDWTQRSSWVKANPNIGVSVFEKDIDIRCHQAIANPQSQASFLTKRLNVRVGASEGAINMLAWDRLCKDESLTINQFQGEQCLMMIDLASKSDLAARMSIFRRGGTYYVFGRYYLPDAAVAPGLPNYEYYAGWTKSRKELVLTPGNITDYDFIEADLLDDLPLYKPLKVGVDPNYNAGQFTTRMLAAGVPMVEVPHNTPSLSEPFKTLAALVLAGKIKHNGDPILRWNIGNVIARIDARENWYPISASRDKKKDAAVATICCLSLHLRLIDSPQWNCEVFAV